MRQANRRLRLVVAVFAIVFAAAFARVAWLQAVKAQALDKLATSQNREEIDVPARRGTIYDRLGVQLAIGERATTVYANPRQITDPRAAAVAAGRPSGSIPTKLYPLLADRSKGFVYVARKADTDKAQALEARGIAGFGFYPEERRAYPQEAVASEVVGYAGIENKGLSGLELELDESPVGPRRREDDRPRSVRPHHRRHRLGAGGEREGRVPDHRPLAPGAGRAHPQASAGEMERGGGHSRRPRSANGRRAGARGRAGIRREHLPDGRALGARPAAKPGGDGHLRARLDLQGRDRSEASSSRASSRRRRSSGSRTRSRSPTGSSTTPSRGGRRR